MTFQTIAVLSPLSFSCSFALVHTSTQTTLPGIHFPQDKLLARCLLAHSDELTWDECLPPMPESFQLYSSSSSKAMGGRAGNQVETEANQWAQEQATKNTGDHCNVRCEQAHTFLSASNGQRRVLTKGTTVWSNSLQNGSLGRTGDSRRRGWEPGEHLLQGLALLATVC